MIQFEGSEQNLPEAVGPGLFQSSEPPIHLDNPGTKEEGFTA